MPPGSMRLHRAKRDPTAGCSAAVGLREQPVERLPRRRSASSSPPRRRRERSCCPPGRLRSLAMLVAARPLPGPDPRRPVALPPDRRPARPPVAPGRAWRCWRSRPRAALAFVFRRWPILLPLAIVAALPFRVPLHAGGDTANLLVPLYLVIAGGVLADGASAGGGAVGGPPRGRFSDRRGGGSPAATGPAGPTAWLPRLLAAVVVLYAVQTLYSEDFSKGLQNVCFFFVPFSLVYGLLRDVSWDRKLLTLVLWVVGIEAVCFVAGRHRWSGLTPQLVLERPGDPVERIPHLLQGQLGLLGPEHLRAVPGAGRRRGDVRRCCGRASGATLALLTALVAVALDRAGADLLAVELRRAAGGPRRACRAEVERALDARRGRASASSWRCSWSSSPAAPRSSAPTASTSTPAVAPTSSPAASTSSPSAPSTATAPAASPRPTASTSRPTKPRSPSPTPSRSPSPPSRAWSASLLYAALVVTALWTMAGGLLRRLSVARRGGPRDLRRPPGPHDGLRRLLRGPDHLGAAGRRRLARSRRAT